MEACTAAIVEADRPAETNQARGFRPIPRDDQAPQLGRCQQMLTRDGPLKIIGASGGFLDHAGPG
jgi:hypothetical protein